MNPNRRMRTGSERGAWLVLLALLAAVVPAGCVLWFMSAAMENVRLAARQRLSDVYTQKLNACRSDIDAFWNDCRTAAADAMSDTDDAPAASFQRLIASGLFDGAVVTSPDGQAAYPTLPAQTGRPEPDGQLWQCARDLEHGLSDPNAAADTYAKLAAEAQKVGDHSEQAMALQSQARCLVRCRKPNNAIDVLLGISADANLARTADSSGRLVVPSARLLALQLMESSDERYAYLALLLIEQVNDYGQPTPAAQRLFLMTSLVDLGIDADEFPTRPAERLAGAYAERPQPPAADNRLTASSEPGLWHMSSAAGRALLLFDGDRLLDRLQLAAELDGPPSGTAIRLEPPDLAVSPADELPFLALPANEHMPGWRLAVYIDEGPLSAAGDKAESAYLAAGIAATVVIAVIAAGIASYVGRQIRLTRLKNDLIATVSHELKTPLASMRVLVDTLREGRCPDERHAGQYLDLIAKENQRLSRLIDNFLTFSRMERNKRAFDFDTVAVAEIVNAAVDAVADRFEPPGAELIVDIPAGVPDVRADQDAMTTVIVNLLDNAWKYTGPHKVVRVGVRQVGSEVRISVADNGVGMSRRAARRVFERFYQVDISLSRQAGGCGLGLAIVKFILDAHGGSIDVASQVGKGSTFIVRLPVAAGSQPRNQG